ncbi:AAA family ATPase, partial [Rhizobiaceae sp. 2RAB30]
MAGETPNLAARLQAIADPGTVVMSDVTRRLVGELFECRDLGSVRLKGLPTEVHAWQVLAPSAVENRFEALHASRLAPLIGRDEELELLRKRWATSCAGEGQVALISGEPGIGKSRLIAALRDDATGDE